MLWGELFACGRGETWATYLKSIRIVKGVEPLPMEADEGNSDVQFILLFQMHQGEQLSCCVYSRLVALGWVCNRFTCQRRTRFRGKSVCFWRWGLLHLTVSTPGFEWVLVLLNLSASIGKCNSSLSMQEKLDSFWKYIKHYSSVVSGIDW